MQQTIMSGVELEGCMNEIEGELHQVEKEISCMLQTLFSKSLKKQNKTKHLIKKTALSLLLVEDSSLKWIKPRVDSLEKKGSSLRVQREHLENRLGLEKKRCDQQHSVKSIKTIPEDQYKDEGLLIEHYGAETRTTFVRRGDMLTLRIANSKTSSVYDSFERGRADYLHSYSSSQSSRGKQFKMSFFKGRSDQVMTYTRTFIDDRWTFTVSQADDMLISSREITLKPDTWFQPQKDSSSVFKSLIALTNTVRNSEVIPDDGFPEKVMRFSKNYVTKIATSFLASDMSLDSEEAIRYSYELDERGLMVEMIDCLTSDCETSSSEYSQLLLHECDSIQLIICLERYFDVFFSVHQISDDYAIKPFIATQQDRIEVYKNIVGQLYNTIDSLDKKVRKGQQRELSSVS